MAEGYRWVTRLTSLAQDWFVEKADPLHPVLFVAQDAYRKLMVDNPDVRYRFSVLDDGHTYRLTGTRGDAAYVGLTFGTPIGKGAVGGRTGTLDAGRTSTSSTSDRNGEVDLLIGPAPAARAARRRTGSSWCPAPARSRCARRSSTERTTGPPSCDLELVGDVPPPILSPDELTPKLEFASLVRPVRGGHGRQHVARHRRTT